jgi:hypothetical protein
LLGPCDDISTFVSNGYLVRAPDIAYTIGEPGPSAIGSVLSAADAVTAKRFVDGDSLSFGQFIWRQRIFRAEAS